MFQATVANLTPDGQFDTPNGHFFGFMVTMSDGMVGTANAKSNPPPWANGQPIGYDIVGERNGIPKLKIDARPKPGTIFSQRVLPVGQVLPPVVANVTPTTPSGIPQQAAQRPIVAYPMPAASPTASPMAHSGPAARIAPQGASVGMSINNAVEILIYNAKCKAEPVDLPHLALHIKAVAEAILEASHSLETGEALKAEEIPF